MGAPPLVNITGLSDALSIAEKEFLEHKIPFIIERTFPTGKIKKIPLSEIDY